MPKIKVGAVNANVVFIVYMLKFEYIYSSHAKKICGVCKIVVVAIKVKKKLYPSHVQYKQNGLFISLNIDHTDRGTVAFGGSTAAL